MEFVVGYLVVVFGLTMVILGTVFMFGTAAIFVGSGYMWYSIISMAKEPGTRFVDLIVPGLVNAFLMFGLFLVYLVSWQWFLASLILGVFMGFWIWLIHKDNRRDRQDGNLD